MITHSLHHGTPGPFLSSACLHRRAVRRSASPIATIATPFRMYQLTTTSRTLVLFGILVDFHRTHTFAVFRVIVALLAIVTALLAIVTAHARATASIISKPHGLHLPATELQISITLCMGAEEAGFSRIFQALLRQEQNPRQTLPEDLWRGRPEAANGENRRVKIFDGIRGQCTLNEAMALVVSEKEPTDLPACAQCGQDGDDEPARDADGLFAPRFVDLIG